MLAGCGSAPDSSFPPLAGPGTAETINPGVTNGWQSISGNTFGIGSTTATASVVAVNPTRLKMELSSTPDVETSTSYQVHCDQLNSFGPDQRGTTPITREIVLPTGAVGSSNDVQCSVTATATKPANARMTLTLFQRLAASKSH